MSYFDRLTKWHSHEFAGMERLNLQAVLPNLTAENDAISGTTSIELLEFSLPKQAVRPDDVFGIIVVTTGGNDIIHNYGRTPPREGAMYGATLAQAEPWIANFETRLQNILEKITSLFPGGCEIFIANIYDPTDGVGDAEHAGLPAWPDGLQLIHRYNDVIARTAEKNSHVHLIDIHAAFLGHGIHCQKFWAKTYVTSDPYYRYFDNLEDPNDRGYDAIRRLYLNAIAQHAMPKLLSDSP